jgi:nucleotide-binding universal stress UspA family protein
MAVVVVGYVAKPEGEAALGAAVAEARLRDATLVAVLSHVAGSDESTGHDGVELRRRIETALMESGVAFEVRGLTHGNDPAEDIVTVADELAAELIVIGLRRRSPVGKLLLGSNAQRVLLDASCPVLAVKAPA